jgi:GNAT superfamily N-acetyltransferase
MTPDQRSNQLQFKIVDASTWKDFEHLFESRGGPKYCWCMVWRVTSEEAKLSNPAWRKAAIQHRVESGSPVGLLGYLDHEPVAWCSIAPKSTYQRLPLLGDELSENIWVLACFFVIRRLRGSGFTRQMIEAAVTYARNNGATMLEAYPVDPDSPSYRFMGFKETFTASGFKELCREGKRRHIMRRIII